MTGRPYLSVVATTRNDDHGGFPLYRTQVFINSLVEQCDRHSLPAELVLVEWNPPADRPRLADALEWPAGKGWCSIRIVEVPNALHAQLKHSDRLPLFQMIGKNVGIRRARGEFVLATNIDIVLSDGLARFIAERRLRHGYLYRADRIDVPAEIDPEWPIERKLSFCESSAVRMNRREGSLDLRSGVFYQVSHDLSFRSWLRNSRLGRTICSSRPGRTLGVRWLAHARPTPHAGLVGRLQDWRAAQRVWDTPLRRVAWADFRTARLLLYYFFEPVLTRPLAIAPGIRRRLREIRMSAAAEEQSAQIAAPRARRLTGKARAFARILRRRLEPIRAAVAHVWRLQRGHLRLNTNASGDFTLMSAEDWRKTQGYAEYEMYSMHIDGLHLYTAHYYGIRERTIPCPAYHIEHGGGFRPEAKGDASLSSTLARRAIPEISYIEFAQLIYDMYLTHAPLVVNSEAWGFAEADLPEKDPVHGKQELAVAERRA